MKKHQSVLLAVGLCLIASLALADNPAMAGRYVYVPERSDRIDQAIATTVAASNFLVRPIARSRLAKTNTPYHTITLAFPENKVSITTDQRAPIVTVPDASPVHWTREDGEVLDVGTGWRGKDLEESLSADDGIRVNHFALSADGRELRMTVTVTSTRLNKPLAYTLVYERH